eukprot:7433631-Lingulodinium_polyedra.AAC.2
MAKLLSLPHIRSPRNGEKIRMKLGELLDMAERRKFVEFIGEAFLSGLRAVLDIDKKDEDIKNTVAGAASAKRGKKASGDAGRGRGRGRGAGRASAGASSA